MNILSIVPPSPAQWDVTVRNTRNSFESWLKSDSLPGWYDVPGHGPVMIAYILGPADADLLTRLAIAGGDHGKFTRTLPVQIEANVTGTFLRHLYTYRAGSGLDGGEPIEPTDVTINSTSVMHTAGKRAIELDDADFDGVDPALAVRYVALLNEQRQAWIATGRKRGPEWQGLVNLMPSGWIYRIHCSINYAVARSMYQSRVNHRLTDWRVWCEALAGLPWGRIVTERRKGVQE